MKTSVFVWDEIIPQAAEYRHPGEGGYVPGCQEVPESAASEK
ncbi:MAG TPA: hypothetical protein VN901_15855 [Candidatus Acidoferrales bacterium]|nr:hypothetical protein [Candidatus Acidoferrales bacterium]